MRKNLQDIDAADEVAIARAARFDVYGTPQNDDIKGSASDENFFVFQGGSDRILGLDGDDRFYFAGAFDATDRANGGSDTDSLILEGRYDDLKLFPNMMRDVERLWLQGLGSFDITLQDGFDDLKISTSSSRSSVRSVNLNGSAVTTGSLNIEGGSHADILIGGALDDRFVAAIGSDTLTGGLGNDRFVYRIELESESFFGADIINDFTPGDVLRLPDLSSGYHIGITESRIGDVVASYDGASNITTVNIFTNSDDENDMIIKLIGYHVDLEIRHGASIIEP